MKTEKAKQVILGECAEIEKQYKENGFEMNEALEARCNALLKIYNMVADERGSKPGSVYKIGKAVFPCRGSSPILRGMAGDWSQKYWITEAWRMVLTNQDCLISI